MKFIDFKHKLSSNMVIDIRNVINLFNAIDRRRLYEWQKKGYIKKLTNNFYIFSDTAINDSFLKMTGNKIYHPSYIGMESALSYYGLIPEAVFQITSITSRKTRNIETAISNFGYRSIHKRFFWGYTLIKDTPHDFFISDPEKTILDYLYLNPELNSVQALKELRLNYETLKRLLNIPRLEKYLRVFSHARLSGSLSTLMEILNVKF